jgi:hypothetical protein
MTTPGCEQFALLAVSDEESERQAAAAHAAGCALCAEREAGWARLGTRVDEWRQAAPAPSPLLERRVLRAGRGRAGRRWLAGLAAAAAVVLSAALLLRLEGAAAGPESSSGRLLAEEALRAADDAERAHARSIARLEAAAAGRLLRAEDPALPAEEAGRLLAYRDRLRFLDRTLAEIHGFLAENPYHAGARAMLLAGYAEKADVLRQVLESQTGGTT